MKYIIIDDAQRGEFAVFCLAPQTHAEMATAWRRDDSRRVVSAGFCEFVAPIPRPGESRETGSCVLVRVFGHSVSLGMGNRGTKDAALITAMYHGTVEMARKDEARQAKFDAGTTDYCEVCRSPVDEPGLCPDCALRQHQEVPQ